MDHPVYSEKVDDPVTYCCDTRLLTTVPNSTTKAPKKEIGKDDKKKRSVRDQCLADMSKAEI